MKIYLSLALDPRVLKDELKQFKVYVKTWRDSGGTNRWSKEFGGKYRVYLPLKLDGSHYAIKRIVEEVVTKMEATIVSYKDNTAKDKHGRETKISKILAIGINKFDLDPALNDKYNADPLRKIKDNDNLEEMMIVISRHPVDVASMSTGSTWGSCMTIAHKTYTPMNRFNKEIPVGTVIEPHDEVGALDDDVKQGTIVAYLVKKNDMKTIVQPKARIAIKPFYNIEDPSDIILIPENKIYGLQVPEFKNSVEEWVKTTFAASGYQYIKNPKIYDDTNQYQITIKRNVPNYDLSTPAAIAEFIANPGDLKKAVAFVNSDYLILKYNSTLFDDAIIYKLFGKLNFKSDTKTVIIDRNTTNKCLVVPFPEFFAVNIPTNYNYPPGIEKSDFIKFLNYVHTTPLLKIKNNLYKILGISSDAEFLKRESKNIRDLSRLLFIKNKKIFDSFYLKYQANTVAIAYLKANPLFSKMKTSEIDSFIQAIAVATDISQLSSFSNATWLKALDIDFSKFDKEKIKLLFTKKIMLDKEFRGMFTAKYGEISDLSRQISDILLTILEIPENFLLFPGFNLIKLRIIDRSTNPLSASTYARYFEEIPIGAITWYFSKATPVYTQFTYVRNIHIVDKEGLQKYVDYSRLNTGSKDVNLYLSGINVTANVTINSKIHILSIEKCKLKGIVFSNKVDSIEVRKSVIKSITANALLQTYSFSNILSINGECKSLCLEYPITIPKVLTAKSVMYTHDKNLAQQLHDAISPQVEEVVSEESVWDGVIWQKSIKKLQISSDVFNLADSVKIEKLYLDSKYITIGNNVTANSFEADQCFDLKIGNNVQVKDITWRFAPDFNYTVGTNFTIPSKNFIAVNRRDLERAKTIFAGYNVK